MMHILMISLDTAIAAQPNGDARARHLAYAQRAGQLTMIVYTQPGFNPAIHVAPELTLLPTNSRNRLTFAWDAITIALRAAQERPFDLVTTQDPFLTGLIGWWLRQRLKIPLLVQNHSYIFNNRTWLRQRPGINHLLHAIGTFTVRRADMYRTVNRKERETYLSWGGSRQRSVALPLGTASEAFAALPDETELAKLRAHLGLSPEHQVVLWVGYPVNFKRVPLLFKVFRQVALQMPTARLVMIGDMTKSPDDLRALAKSEGIADKLIQYGPIPHDELPLYYALGVIYVHTSSYEGVPRVLFEASAAGLPLVGMDVVGVNEVIDDGINGYLAPDLDIDGMAGRILHLLEDPSLAEQMGAAAQDNALEKYNFETYVESWVQVMERAVRMGMRG